MDPLLAEVIGCVERVLQAYGEIGPETSLLDREDFDSIAIADLISEVETALGTELAPELIVPETFATPESLRTAMAGCGAAATRAVLGASSGTERTERP
ncbi:acyl carrier protein [Streptomyces sp. 8N706]|uniref:acyl carrier protein n=1 Tax=Streptomyces sp. 8N706 TaxID=3457416 RepID=UPI003FD6985C